MPERFGKRSAGHGGRPGGHDRQKGSGRHPYIPQMHYNSQRLGGIRDHGDQDLGAQAHTPGDNVELFVGINMRLAQLAHPTRGWRYVSLGLDDAQTDFHGSIVNITRKQLHTPQGFMTITIPGVCPISEAMGQNTCGYQARNPSIVGLTDKINPDDLADNLWRLLSDKGGIVWIRGCEGSNSESVLGLMRSFNSGLIMFNEFKAAFQRRGFILVTPVMPLVSNSDLALAIGAAKWWEADSPAVAFIKLPIRNLEQRIHPQLHL